MKKYLKPNFSMENMLLDDVVLSSGFQTEENHYLETDPNEVWD